MQREFITTMLPEPTISVLGPDPAHRRCVLNGNAFQQDVLVSFNGWQYAAFYASVGDQPEPLFVHIARRELPGVEWEVLVLDDYPQTVDDGHNTVQMGVCAGDGTIHLAYDHHCDVLRYRLSVPSLALSPKSHPWTPTLFSPTLSHLPGLPVSHANFHYVTYPRFIATGSDLLLSFRDGKAGLGNDHLYSYSPATGEYSFVGTPLTGIQSNPYVHGLDFRNGKIHVTWVYRGFVFYEGWDDVADTKHKQQAGPNGMENNHDICYAYSEDGGHAWRNNQGIIVADLKKGETVDNSAEGIVVWKVDKGKGLMNQEAQAVDPDGGVHVLNRDWVGDGGYEWKHYYREPRGKWTKTPVRPINGNRRGRLAITKTGDLYLILPDSETPTIRILRAAKADGYGTYELVWEGHGYSGEPLVDVARLEHDDVLSVFIRRDGGESLVRKEVVVLDFQLSV